LLPCVNTIKKSWTSSAANTCLQGKNSNTFIIRLIGNDHAGQKGIVGVCCRKDHHYAPFAGGGHFYYIQGIPLHARCNI
jgi:hypothetical protein